MRAYRSNPESRWSYVCRDLHGVLCDRCWLLLLFYNIVVLFAKKKVYPHLWKSLVDGNGGLEKMMIKQHAWHIAPPFVSAILIGRSSIEIFYFFLETSKPKSSPTINSTTTQPFSHNTSRDGTIHTQRRRTWRRSWRTRWIWRWTRWW